MVNAEKQRYKTNINTTLLYEQFSCEPTMAHCTLLSQLTFLNCPLKEGNIFHLKLSQELREVFYTNENCQNCKQKIT